MTADATPRCETCRHWGQKTDNGNYRVCGKIVEIGPGPAFVVSASVGSLMTKPEFGCVLHEPHEPIEAKAPLRRVWSEDDATVGQWDHEGWTSAWKRLTGKTFVPDDVAEVIDPNGETTFRMKNGWEIRTSHPGDNEIWAPS